jgi:hypothetical protein
MSETARCETGLFGGWFSVCVLARGDLLHVAEQGVGVRQGADEAAHRRRGFFDQRGGRDDLVNPRQLRLLVDVDDLESEIVLQFQLTKLMDAPEGLARPGGGSGHVKPKEMLFRAPAGQKLVCGLGCTAGLVFFQGARFG